VITNITNNYNYRNNIHHKPAKKAVDQSNAKKQLAKVLFGKTLPGNNLISFGWSKHLTEIETKILDVLTDPNNKVAIVTSHSYPDGDAYGSNLGIAGILESMGKQVHSVIDFRPKKSFQYLPSPDPALKANDYIQKPEHLESIKKSDIAVITDTGEPALLNENKNHNTNKMLDLICKTSPKKIIIIDHHSDDKKGPTNYDMWLKQLKSRGIKEDNVLYWRELRASAAEMVSELDQELVKESKKRSIPGYNPNFNHNYRLSVATGIITDAGGTTHPKGEVDKTRFNRLSYDKVTDKTGKQISKTRYDFDWLINNCDIPKEEIDTTKCVSMPVLDQALIHKIRNIIDGKEKVDGIEVKTPTKNDPMGYIYIHKYSALNKMAKEAPEKWLKGNVVYRIFKSEMAEKLMNDNNSGIWIIANKSGKNTYLAARSYGYDTYNGEMYQNGHVFCNNLALKVINALEPQYGSGGGHKNAAGFKSKDNVSFKKDILPVIKKVVEDYTRGRDIRELPDIEKLKAIAFTDILENKTA
jgi:nanoRNase/pAp phosphatase (c-di-AMP/oligoRNAs hydrolase)